MSGHPCGNCLRWPECNGVAWETPDCPYTPEEKPEREVVPAYLEDKTESGLFEED